MPIPLEEKYVALGVGGSIACHKAVDLASKLTQAGALVEVREDRLRPAEHIGREAPRDHEDPHQGKFGSGPTMPSSRNQARAAAMPSSRGRVV